MIVYRTMLDIYNDRLYASGKAARWNSKDVKMIYSASSRALACLENIVHRNSRGLNKKFKTILIEIPNGLKIQEINCADLIAGWRHFQNTPYTRKMGDQCIRDGLSAVLKIPSVIIPEENNYLLNPSHADFNTIKYLGSEPFRFDERIK